MNTYTTLEGRVLEYPDPTPAEAAFLKRVKAAVNDPAVSWSDMISLVHGPDNPILDRDYLPGRYSVTVKVAEHPLYYVFSDLIGRKDVALGRLDLDQMLAAYTVDVPTAAAELGLTQQAVRAAIDARRLSAVRKDGRWWLRPEAIASYRVSAAGRPRKAVGGGKGRNSAGVGTCRPGK